MAEYTPMSDTSTALRDALVERDLLRCRLTQMQEQSNRDEEARRGLARGLKVTRSALRSVMESLADRDEEIQQLKNRALASRTAADNV